MAKVYGFDKSKNRIEVMSKEAIAAKMSGISEQLTILSTQLLDAIADVSDKEDANTNTLNVLNNMITTINTNVASINTKCDNIIAKLDAQDAKMESMQTDITAIKTRVNA